MALSINFTGQQEDTAEESAINAWTAQAVLAPETYTWQVIDGVSFYTGRDTSSGYVVHVPKTGTINSIDIGHRETGGKGRRLGVAVGEDFTGLRAHLAGLV